MNSIHLTQFINTRDSKKRNYLKHFQRLTRMAGFTLIKHDPIVEADFLHITLF